MKPFFFLFILPVAASFAQELKFDVAAVRPNTLNDHIVTIDDGPGGRFNARGYSLKLLIQYAYSVKGFQVQGGPSWLDVDRWDIAARAAGDATAGQRRQMMQALLSERFGLRVRKARREMPGFELAVAGSPAKVKASTSSEENPGESRRVNGALVSNAITMATLAKFLGAYLARPVVDNTGIKGLYDISLSWNERADQVPDAESAGVSLPGVSLIAAVRDQLGLKLTAKRVSAEVIEVDRAGKASPN
jgi:uncharacterized protein (TIGR03435 family)